MPQTDLDFHQQRRMLSCVLSPTARRRIDRALLFLSALAVFGLIVGMSESNGNKNGPQIAFRLASVVFIVLTSVRAVMSRKTTRSNERASKLEGDQS